MMTNIITNSKLNKVELDLMELEKIAGGWLVEKTLGHAKVYGDIYNAGISIESTWFGPSRYYISGHQISREQADEIVDASMDLWKQYQADGSDWVAYARAWKQILKSQYSIEWDGIKGNYSHPLW